MAIKLEPGMVIRCKTIDEACELVTYTNSYNYFAALWTNYKEDTCYKIGFKNRIDVCGHQIPFVEDGEKIIEFSELDISNSKNENEQSHDYQEGLKKGREEAWELARKIAYDYRADSYDTDELAKMFGLQGIVRRPAILNNYSAQEVFEKIENYKKEKSASIHINDEVILRGNLKGVVTYIHSNKTVDLLLENGLTSHHERQEDLKKTGRTVNVYEILSKLNEKEQNDYERE